jgi:precorrin-2/cobalt-factor-2 C20-methyltransferase
MTQGTLYGIGVGPGDPEWITVKAVKILAACRHVCVPKSDSADGSVALEIARAYLRPDAIVHQQSYPMTADTDVLRRHWRQAADEVLTILRGGEDCCFLTLGDALLYSTYIYLLRELVASDPAVRVVTVPGVTAFSAAAALANRPVGEGKQLVTIVPAADDLAQFSAALDRGGTVVLMKVGRRLHRALDHLESRHLLDHTVFVSRAGMPEQYVEIDVRRLRALPEQAGYLSVLIVQAGGPGAAAVAALPLQQREEEV